MNTVTVKGVGIITIPERNTEEEIIHIVNQLKDDVETLNEMLEIKPIENIWCEHEECLEEIDPFDSEEDLVSHILKN
jgi:ASC-1-like (ASCH) protein